MAAIGELPRRIQCLAILPPATMARNREGGRTRAGSPISPWAALRGVRMSAVEGGERRQRRGGNLHPREEAGDARTGTIQQRGSRRRAGHRPAARGLGGSASAGGMPAMASSPMPTRPSVAQIVTMRRRRRPSSSLDGAVGALDREMAPTGDQLHSGYSGEEGTLGVDSVSNGFVHSSNVVPVSARASRLCWAWPICVALARRSSEG